MYLILITIKYKIKINNILLISDALFLSMVESQRNKNKFKNPKILYCYYFFSFFFDCCGGNK